MPTSSTPKAPALRLLGLEPIRAALEFIQHVGMPPGTRPRGDGHPVVVFPGLASDGRATAPLRRFCAQLGYEVHDWGRGFNTGPEGEVTAWLEGLTRELASRIGRSGRRVSLIGWSLGGIYAREVAKRLPGRVRRVITIGTPLTGDPAQTHASLIYRVLNGRLPPLDRRLRAQLRRAPPVPTTSIYSRSDGIVAWQACVQQGRPAQVDNVEIDGSHCGMGWNAAVLDVVAARLALRGR